MKILGICLSAGKGGLELYAHAAISSMQKMGHDCYFALSPQSFLRQLDWQLPLEEISPAARRLPLLSARRLAAYIDSKGIDIIHMHWNQDLTLVALAKSLSRRKPKLVYSRHMEITKSKKDFYHRLVYRQVNLMLVISRFVFEQAARYLPLAEEQIKLLYVGVSTIARPDKQTCQDLVPECFAAENDFVVGLVGRIEHGKGQHVMLEAMAILKEKNIRPSLVIAGPVMDEAYYHRLLEEIQNKGLSPNIHYIGMTREPQKLMGCCDVVVLTTFCETFGLVLAEAMRVGTAVVGTDAGGVPEIIHHDKTGLLYAPGDAAQLAGQLEELYRDQEKRKALSIAGKAYADEMFDEEQHMQRLETLLTGLGISDGRH